MMLAIFVLFYFLTDKSDADMYHHCAVIRTHMFQIITQNRSLFPSTPMQSEWIVMAAGM